MKQNNNEHVLSLLLEKENALILKEDAIIVLDKLVRAIIIQIVS